jgi:hypothetical protein
MQHVLEQRTITPELAVKLLEKNISNNRNIKASVVEKYYQDMSSGNWKLSDALKFDKEGNLIDGQHRLHAIIKFNRPVDFLVVENYDTESAQYLDIGSKRTVKDIADLQGKTDFTVLTGSVLRNVLILSTECFVARSAKFTEQQILDVYDQLRKEVEYAFELRQNTKVAKTAALGVFVCAANYYDVINNSDSEKAQRLAQAKEVMITGITDDYNNPLIPMRDFIMTTALNSRENINRAMKTVDYALHLYMTGVGRKRIVLPKEYEIKHKVSFLSV